MFFSFLLASMLTLSDPRADLLNLLGGEWVSQGIYVAAKLDIAEHLQKGPKTTAELADLLQVNESALARLMGMLASHGVFEQREGKVFANTALSERIAQSHPDTLRSLVIFYGEEIHQSFGSLLSSIQTGNPAFNEIYQEPVFAYFKHHPERAALFHSAMAEKTKAVIQSVLHQINFQGTVCDIGAGKGHLLYAVLKANPQLQGIQFDLPEIISALPELPPRVTTQAGSFFQSIPKADAYLMKSILHDWSDEEALAILRICHSSMPDKATLYVIEPVLMPSTDANYAKLMDILMLAVTGGKERSLEEYQTLFEQSGFQLGQIYSTPTEFRILEVKKTATNSAEIKP
jgi:hypothetical protein